MIAVMRIRGDVGLKPDVRKVFELLKLDRKFTVAFLPDTPEYIGMVKKVTDYVTWGEVPEKTVKELEGKIRNVGRAFPVFHLHPPRGGFKHSIKKHYPYGELGKRENMKELIERMVP